MVLKHIVASQKRVYLHSARSASLMQYLLSNKQNEYDNFRVQSGLEIRITTLYNLNFQLRKRPFVSERK